MPDANATIWKSSFWILLLALIFVYALYNHYAGVLKGELRQVNAELQTTSLQLSSVDTALGATKQEAQTAEQKIQELTAAHEANVRSITSDHEQAIADLKQEHEEAVATLQQGHEATIARATAAHEETLSQVQADLKASSQARDGLQQEFDMLTAAKSQVDDQLAEVKKSESSLNERLVAVTEIQHELEAKLAADNAAIAGLNFQLNSANQLEAALRDKLRRGAERQERLKTLVDKEEAAIEELKSKLVLTTQQREAMPETADAAALQQQIAASRARSAQLAAEVEKLREDLAAGNRALEAARQSAADTAGGEQADAVAVLQAELERLRARQTEQVAELEAARANAADAAQALQQGRAALREELAQTKSEHAEALASAEERIAATETALEQERSTLEAQLEQAQTASEQANAEASARAEKLNMELTAGREAMESLKTAHAAELQELNDRLAQADAAFGDLRAEMQRQRADYDKALAEAEASGKASLNQVRSLYDNAAALGGRLTDQGILLSLAGDELQFPSGTATLPEGDLPTLDRIAALLKQRADLSARVEGHTDSSGSAAVNQDLSQQRADAVMAALVARGVDAGRLSAKGYGAERPIASNATLTGRRANRRVEVYVVE